MTIRFHFFQILQFDIKYKLSNDKSQTKLIKMVFKLFKYIHDLSKIIIKQMHMKSGPHIY